MNTTLTGSGGVSTDTAAFLSENEFRLFVEENGRQLDCSYCGESFRIDSYEDLERARYVQAQLGSGIKRHGGPFCCPACYQRILEKRTKYCRECGQHIESGTYCNRECAIAFCEN